MKSQKTERKSAKNGVLGGKKSKVWNWGREKIKNQKWNVNRQREKVQKMEIWEGENRKFVIGGGKKPKIQSEKSKDREKKCKKWSFGRETIESLELEEGIDQKSKVESQKTMGKSVKN